jgi:hypothetical protein
MFVAPRPTIISKPPGRLSKSAHRFFKDADMGAFLRLRQICLVAADLAAETQRIKTIFGLEECYRDPNVGRYGLENVLFPVGSSFIEIVAPTRPGTTAGRFLERFGGRYGYMIIMDCDDPEARRLRALSLGIRIASAIHHDDYFGVQLHPKDTDAAMLEFNSTVGGDYLNGAYYPAGKHWQAAVRDKVTRGLLAAGIECPDPGALARRWAELLQRSAPTIDGRTHRIDLDAGAIEFSPTRENYAALVALTLQVADRDHILMQARRAGCENPDGTVSVCGVRFRLAG